MRERGLALAREGSREGACNVDAVWMPDVDRGVLGSRVHTDTHSTQTPIGDVHIQRCI